MDDLDAIVCQTRLMGWESEREDWGEDRLREAVATVLEDPDHGTYLVARADGAVVGQVLVQFMPLNPSRGGRLALLDDVYVRPAWRGFVIDELLDAAERLARSRPGVVGMRLLVNLDNVRAQRAYQRHALYPDGHIGMTKLFDTNLTSMTEA